MDIFTLYVGQGDLAAVRAGDEAIIIDAHMPNTDNVTQEQIETSLDCYLSKKNVRGLIITGLDRDHACPAGVDSILTRYQPNWVMYPTYYKDTDAASEVFEIIEREVKRRAKSLRPLERISVHLNNVDSRYFTNLAKYFSFELFSPHKDDMDCSNNCSIVLKVKGLDSSGFTYMITGDTEKERWDQINRFFGASLRSNVLSAAHHGALSGVNAKSLLLIEPHTVLISAGVDNSYGHPHGSAIKAYREVAKQVFSTHVDSGSCLFTQRLGGEYKTTLVQHSKQTSAYV